MNNKIDLSKAYAGQIITLRDGSKRTIYRCGVFGSVFAVLDGKVSELPYYAQNGRNAENNNTGLDIVAIEDPIQVQAARIEGEIKGLEWAISIISNAHDKMCIVQVIEDLKDQLKALTENN